MFGQANNDAAGEKACSEGGFNMCVQIKRGPVKLRLLFHSIVHAVQIIAPESMRGNIKEDKINLFTDVVVSFNPVAE